ncbi:MAG: hypothetical protein RL701_2239, partial [Pseudomonadota bacterium]
MDIDFHYHATFAAARFAGFSAADALTIATSAQMIDENGRHVLVKKTGTASGFFGMRDDFELREQAHGQSLHTFRVQMTFQGLGDIGSSSDDTLASIWPVYHFLPGNFVPQALRATTQTTLQDLERNGPPVVQSPLWRLRDLKSGNDATVQQKFRWLCRPHSPMAIGLVNNCTDLVHDRSSQVYKQSLTPYLVGVTMHVFIDTWAHQDFVGPASRAINGREGKPSIAFAGSTDYYNLPSTFSAAVDESAPYRHELTESKWSGTAPGLITREAANIYVGHGQVGHWPDHSALIWKYQPAWSSAPITRMNPVQYFDAFVHMVYAMLCIRNNRQYTPFEINPTSLNTLYALSAASAGDEGVALTADRLRTINYLICRERDPWGVGSDPELPDEISDNWDKAIYLYGRKWQEALSEKLFPDQDITTDWVPGASDWVHETLQTFKSNMSMSSVGASHWLNIQQFQALPFVRFNLAAKFHYRFVRQQLIAFGESLIGSWADGAAYADDLLRVENIPSIRELVPWRIKIIDVLSLRQRVSKTREVVDGMAILISEIEGSVTIDDAVRILDRAINPEGDDAYTYGMKLSDDGSVKHGSTYDAIADLIKQMKATRGFTDTPVYLALPTVAEWERRSSVMLAMRSSDPTLVIIDRALKAVHRILNDNRGDRSEAWRHASEVVAGCEAWPLYTNREKKRAPAVTWLLRATQDWLKNEQARTRVA